MVVELDLLSFDSSFMGGKRRLNLSFCLSLSQAYVVVLVVLGARCVPLFLSQRHGPECQFLIVLSFVLHPIPRPNRLLFLVGDF